MIDTALSILDRLLRLKGLKDARNRQAFQDIFRPAFEDLERIHRDYLEIYNHVEARLPDFEFLSKPGTKWRKEYDYINFRSEKDALRFLRLEGRGDETPHRTLIGKGYCITYPTPAGEPPITIIFRHRHDAVIASEQLGLQDAPVAYVPPADETVYPALLDLIAFVKEKRIEFEPVRVRLRLLSRTFADVSLGTHGDLFVRSVLNYFPDGELNAHINVGEYDQPDKRFLGMGSGSSTILEALEPVLSKDAVGNYDLLNKASSEAQWLVRGLKDHQQKQWEKVAASFAQLQAERLRMWR